MRVAAGVVLLLAPAACVSRTDVIDVSSAKGSDPPTIVLHGRRSACGPHAVTHGSPTVKVANFLSAGTCASEVAVFATLNAMSLVDAAKKWTDASGDVVAVPMQDPYVVPLNIFIMSGDLVTHSPTVRQTEAATDVLTASTLFDNQQCGMTFSITINKNSTRGNFPPDLLTASCNGNVGKFKAVDSVNTAVKGINIFYYDGQYGVLGETCIDGNSAVITMSKYSTAGVLAHELGHAMTLEHTNAVAGMPIDDLMMSPSAFPSTLTTGQCFRANVNADSRLNTLPVRTDPTRACPDSTTGPTCPPLTTHK